MVYVTALNLTNLFSRKLDAGSFRSFPAATVQSNFNYVIACDSFEFEKRCRLPSACTTKRKAMMRVLKPLQDRATTGAGKRLVLPEPHRVRFLIRGEGSVSAGAVTIECCPGSTKAGKFWMELATIPVPADGLAQYYTEEASGLFRARISRPVSNGTVTVTPLVSRGPPDRPDSTKVV